MFPSSGALGSKSSINSDNGNNVNDKNTFFSSEKRISDFRSSQSTSVDQSHFSYPSSKENNNTAPTATTTTTTKMEDTMFHSNKSMFSNTYSDEWNNETEKPQWWPSPYNPGNEYYC